MKIQTAIAWEAGAPLSIEEVELDEPRADEILVRVEAVGVCHTDDKARHAKLPVVFPVILGHEGSGTVERAGADVTKVRPGDRVLFTPDYCGHCPTTTLSRGNRSKTPLVIIRSRWVPVSTANPQIAPSRPASSSGWIIDLGGVLGCR
jgi:Zn-dependent alcohol dehydrogenase